ncbi:B-cell receptor CD22-like isoform X3 [Perca fluviatilis]|uniref:B-cell receptor CD22-like isoform X3 n=1 Tax=Perca fluviatilis TaxID=8168 RepID=UPI0019636E93|nr:B-cell receptor CD22-like isoform X3 [Perca fluviatilis]
MYVIYLQACFIISELTHREMRGAAWSLTAAASGLVVLLLTVPVIQSQNGWGVTYTSTQICALKGSTVEIRCSYRYPSTNGDGVKEAFWFTKESNNVYVDLKMDLEYSDRVQFDCKKKGVQYHSENKDCTLRISDLRQSDSAVYKFRFRTDDSTGKYTGLPGVTLLVADPQLQVHVRRSTVRSHQQPTWTELTCHNKCQLPDHYSYIWYKNGQKFGDKKVYFHLDLFNPADNYSCAVSKYEMFPSPSVYVKLPSVSVSPSGDLMEGSSVNVTCSSDANPAANYSWYKNNLVSERLSEGPQLIFSSIQSSDSGQYYCTAENMLGRTSANISINVKYGPKLPSVSVSPSAEIVEGSSVNLTCSSDANPAANYTWYKENEDSPKASGQIFTITDIRAEHSGNYYCEAQNRRGRQNSTLHLTVVAVFPETWKSVIIGTIPAVFLVVVWLSIFLLIRKKRTSKQLPEPGDGSDNREQVSKENNSVQRSGMNFTTPVSTSPRTRQTLYTPTSDQLDSANMRGKKKKKKKTTTKWSMLLSNLTVPVLRREPEVRKQGRIQMHATVQSTKLLNLTENSSISFF